MVRAEGKNPVPGRLFITTQLERKTPFLCFISVHISLFSRFFSVFDLAGTSHLLEEPNLCKKKDIGKDSKHFSSFYYLGGAKRGGADLMVK